MATITITIPDNQVARVLDAFAARYGWPATVVNAQNQQVANPETKAQFARQRVADYVRGVTVAYEADRDADAARAAAAANAIQVA